MDIANPYTNSNKLKNNVLSVLILLVVSMLPENLHSQFKRPGNANAADCFTYHSGIDCHLDGAAPQFDEFGFKGTFYATGNSQSLYKRMEE
jgi:peptidoglycan-N-acetylglucosamine deacetylase